MLYHGVNFCRCIRTSQFPQCLEDLQSTANCVVVIAILQARNKGTPHHLVPEHISSPELLNSGRLVPLQVGVNILTHPALSYAKLHTDVHLRVASDAQLDTLALLLDSLKLCRLPW